MKSIDKNILKAIVAIAVALAFIVPGTAAFANLEKTTEQNMAIASTADWEMTIEDTTANPGDQIEVEMTGVWSDSLGGFSAFVDYDTDNLSFVGADWTGSPFENIQNIFALEDPLGYLSIGMVVFFEEYPEANATTIVKLIFNVSTSASDQAELIFDAAKDNVYSYTNGSTVPAVTTDGTVYFDYELTVNIEGSGTVDLDPAGPYPVGTTVTLTAVPDEGWEFVEWTGDITGSDNPADLLMDDDKEVTATFEELPKIPDLDADGDLTWADVKAGDTVTSTIDVENIGDAESLLDWEVDSYPDWGTWSFDPDSGTDLTPEDGVKTIDVSVVAPDEEDQTFTGTVVLVNSEDSSDTVEISVELVTPRAKITLRNVVIEFLELLAERFPIVANLLNL